MLISTERMFPCVFSLFSFPSPLPPPCTGSKLRLLIKNYLGIFIRHLPAWQLQILKSFVSVGMPWCGLSELPEGKQEGWPWLEQTGQGREGSKSSAMVKIELYSVWQCTLIAHYYRGDVAVFVALLLFYLFPSLLPCTGSLLHWLFKKYLSI